MRNACSLYGSPDVLNRTRIKIIAESAVWIGGEQPFAFHRNVRVVESVIGPVTPVEELPCGYSSGIFGTFDTGFVEVAFACLASDDNLYP